MRSNAISIHALREEGDRIVFGVFLLVQNFYPRPPRGGRLVVWFCSFVLFYFYPRPPRGGRRRSCKVFTITSNFYPRPPRGGRRRSCKVFTITSNFYPRPPRGGRHTTRELLTVHLQISIHALREEGDLAHIMHSWNSTNFYPRPPRGGRRFPHRCRAFDNIFLSTPSARRATNFAFSSAGSALFLSTPSARRATLRLALTSLSSSISIHALREEGDH